MRRGGGAAGDGRGCGDALGFGCSTAVTAAPGRNGLIRAAKFAHTARSASVKRERRAVSISTV
jgi:hypothetical protein